MISPDLAKSRHFGERELRIAGRHQKTKGNTPGAMRLQKARISSGVSCLL